MTELNFYVGQRVHSCQDSIKFPFWFVNLACSNTSTQYSSIYVKFVFAYNSLTSLVNIIVEVQIHTHSNTDDTNSTFGNKRQISPGIHNLHGYTIW